VTTGGTAATNWNWLAVPVEELPAPLLTTT
jgi:hypothetical protein